MARVEEQIAALDKLAWSAQDVADAPPGRRLFMEAMAQLMRGEAVEAQAAFRRAARECEAPFDALSLVGQATCEQAQGQTGKALVTYRKAASGQHNPVSLRALAWLNVAALEETRGHARQAEAARAQAEALEPGSTGTEDEAR